MFRAPGAYHRRPRGHGYHGTHDPRFLLLISQLMHQVYQMESKPPVTVAVLAMNLALHLQPQLFADILQIPSISAGCLQPYSIVRRREWSRLLWSGFLHGNDAHVYYNMSSLLWKGAQLEPRMGSLRFAALLAELLVVSHGLVVALFYTAARVMPVEFTSSYRNLCAVGFSAVLFGLKVVLQFDSPGSSSINVPLLGRLSLPTRHLCWAELLIAQILVPNASFTGHLCGICAGLLHVGVTRHLIRQLPQLLPPPRPSDRRRASSTASPRSHNDSPPPRPAQDAHASGYASYDRSHWAQRPYYNSSDPVAVRRAKANRR